MKQALGITLNCLVLAISGVLALFGAFALVIAGTVATTSVAYLTGFGITNIAAYVTLGGAVLLILAVVSFALCYGLWKHYDIAWWACLFLLGIGIVADIIAIAFFGYAIAYTAITIGLSIVLILALLHRDTISAIKPDIEYRGWVLEV